MKKKSEKGINNQRNNLYYIKGNKYIHTHAYTNKTTRFIHITRRTRKTGGTGGKSLKKTVI